MKLSEKRGNMLHGILLIALFSCAAFYISDLSFVKSLSFSPLIVGIILGMLYANSLRNRLPETWVPGILFCSKQILRLGIILYGFKLTFQDVMAVGLPAILIDIIVVTVTICGGVLIGKWMKMEKEITLLTSVGSAICGAAAILGAESTIKSKPYPNRCRHFNRGDFRYDFHVFVSGTLPEWDCRPDTGSDGDLYRFDSTRSGARRRCRKCHG